MLHFVMANRCSSPSVMACRRT